HQVRLDADGPIQDGLGHFTSASPLPRSTSTARAITGGMGTPILPAFSVMDRSSFARYQKMAASMMRDWSPSTVSARWATATTRNTPTFLAIPLNPIALLSLPSTAAAATPVR